MISHCLGDAMRRLVKIPAEFRAAEVAQLPATCSHADCTTGMGCRDYITAMLAQETHRHQCEARGWLRRGYTTRPKVAELVRVIAEKRGQEAADALRAEMRRQWNRRGEWLGRSA